MDTNRWQYAVGLISAVTSSLETSLGVDADFAGHGFESTGLGLSLVRSGLGVGHEASDLE